MIGMCTKYMGQWQCKLSLLCVIRECTRWAVVVYIYTYCFDGCFLQCKTGLLVMGKWEDEARLDGCQATGSIVNWSVMRVTEKILMSRQVVVMMMGCIAKWMSDGPMDMIG